MVTCTMHKLFTKDCMLFSNSLSKNSINRLCQESTVVSNYGLLVNSFYTSRFNYWLWVLIIKCHFCKSSTIEINYSREPYKLKTIFVCQPVCLPTYLLGCITTVAKLKLRMLTKMIVQTCGLFLVYHYRTRVSIRLNMSCVMHSIYAMDGHC